MNTAVGFTSDQIAKVKAILKKSEDDIDTLKKEMPTWNDEAKAAIDKIWVKERVAILGVLDSSRQKKYETYFKNWTDERAKDKH